MKLVLLSLGVSLLAYSPVFSIPRDRIFDHNNGFYQAVPVTGKVTDDKDQPLPGVTVAAKGTQRVTQTNEAGSFSLEMPAGVTVLVFSYAGMETQEVNVGTSTSISVRLKPAEAALEDVVVIGYGTQKRANVTGAVATVTGNTLTERPAPNSVNLLQGRLPGLTVNQNTAEPGRDGNSLLIRGRSSFTGSNAPLVLIDGVPGSLNNLSPDDIETATVLKDAASASIYGARAANGVILVTTKKGKKGATQFSYRTNISRHSATRLPEFITNSAEYMEMFNAAIDRGRTNGVPVRYPQAEIEKYRTPSDEYPSFNYIDHYVRPALVHNHNLSMSGGSEKNTFNISLSYLDQNALLPGYNFKRYNGLINYTSQLTKAITIGTIINATYKNRQEPPFTGENMMLAVYAAGPLYGPFLPDGSGRIVTRAYEREGRNRNPQEMYEMGWQNNKEYNLNGQVFVDIKLMKNLVWSSKAAINYVDEYYKMYQHNYNSYLLQERDATTGDYRMWTFGPDIVGVTDQYSKLLQPTLYSTLTYNTQFGDHNLKVLAGYEQVSQRNQGLRGRRISTVSQALTDLTGYNNTNESLYFSHPRLPGNVNPQEWGLRSFFGRVNYDFQGKYFLEGNLRYDGTSKVHPDYRWGLFPSVSAGWMISRENFLQDKFYWLTDLKLRGSYGVLGNQDIGTYLYQDVLTISNVQYPFGNQPAVQGAVNNTFRDKSLQWESTRVLDFGFDLVIQKGLVGLTFDWFNKYTYDILAAPLIPASIGMNAPTINNGRMRNLGIELSLTHQNRIGKVSYGLNGIVSTARNEVLEVRIPSFGTTTVQVGAPYNSYYLYLWDGIVQEGETPIPHSQTTTLMPGDIKMRDVSGPEGKPDGRITPDDRVIVKGAYPDYTYSFGGNVDYKGFGLTFFFQGVQGVKSRVLNWGVDPFMQGTPPTTDWRNAWTPENQSQSMPAIYIKDYPHMNNYNGSTYFLRDASYLRLKNVTLSYTFPRVMMSRLKVKDLMLYVSADNLVTWTDFKNGDPERANFSTAENSPSTNFSQYPQTRILNVGLNVKF